MSEFLQRKEIDLSKVWAAIETLLKQIKKKNTEQRSNKIVGKCQKFIEKA